MHNLFFLRMSTFVRNPLFEQLIQARVMGDGGSRPIWSCMVQQRVIIPNRRMKETSHEYVACILLSF